MTTEWDMIDLFEAKVAEYTGAPYAVAVDSCTNALFLALKYQEFITGRKDTITIPLRTYISIPQTIIHAGREVQFAEHIWADKGRYVLDGSNVWDAAKRFTPDMYLPNQMMCLSFHTKKPIGIGKGGMILTDDYASIGWLRKARYEGRTTGVDYKEDDLSMLGWNMYMTPEQAVRGLQLMKSLPPAGIIQLEEGGYPDLSQYRVFRDIKVVDA